MDTGRFCASGGLGVKHFVVQSQAGRLPVILSEAKDLGGELVPGPYRAPASTCFFASVATIDTIAISPIDLPMESSLPNSL